MKERIGIVGGGSMGTAIVKIIQSKSLKLNWYIRNPKIIEHIKDYYHNPDYLTYVQLIPDNLDITDDIKSLIDNSDIIIWAIPSAFLHDTIKSIDRKILKNKIHISSIKGIVSEFNVSVSEYFNKEFDVPYQNIGIIAGPCHAEEVAMEKLSYLTVVSSNQNIIKIIRELLICRYINVNVSSDIIGIEYATVLKNIVAIAAGICFGIGYGDNFQSILTINAINEIERFINVVCPTRRNINDSVYAGDIIVTMYSNFSRNRVFGTLIGKGYSVQYSRIEIKMISEGYYAVKSIHEINKSLNIDLPIINAVYNILYENTSPAIEMKILEEKLS